MEPFNDKVGDAQRGVDAAKGEVDKVNAELQQLKKGDLGWWRASGGSCATTPTSKKLWAEQGNQVAMAVQKEASSVA